MSDPDAIHFKARQNLRLILRRMVRGAGVGAILLLALALGLAGGSRAMALGHAPGMVAMVICADGGTKTIYLRSDGGPVEPMADCASCPDCLQTPAVDVSRTQILRSWGIGTFIAHGLTTPSTIHRARRLRPETRGPPPEAKGFSTLASAAALFGAAAGPCDHIGRPLTDARP